MAFQEFAKAEAYEISMADLVPLLKSDKLLDEPERISKFLWYLGMDVDKGVEVMICQHRQRFTPFGVNHCERFNGVERSDTKWLELKRAIALRLV